MIDELAPAVRELAVCMYNRLGSEGMSSRSDSEIGISSAFVDIPATVIAARYSVTGWPASEVIIMRRLRQSLKRVYHWRKATPSKDAEGNTYTAWGDPVEIDAIIRRASGKIAAAQYGERLQYICKMQYDGAELSLRVMASACMYPAIMTLTIA